jgi:hypothetical protein
MGIMMLSPRKTDGISDVVFLTPGGAGGVGRGEEFGNKSG